MYARCWYRMAGALCSLAGILRGWLGLSRAAWQRVCRSCQAAEKHIWPSQIWPAHLALSHLALSHLLLEVRKCSIKSHARQGHCCMVLSLACRSAARATRALRSAIIPRLLHSTCAADASMQSKRKGTEREGPIVPHAHATLQARRICCLFVPSKAPDLPFEGPARAV